MARTDAEILQTLKESASAKKLSSVSDITLQKIAAQISKLNLSEEVENVIIEAEKEKLVILNDNIRNETAKQKAETEALYKQNPPKEPTIEPAKVELPKEILAVVEYVNTLKTKEQQAEKKGIIEKTIYEKGVPKEKKDFVEKILSTLNITPESNEIELAETVVDLYNVATVKSGGNGVPNKPNGNAGDEADKTLVDKALENMWK